jgi:hypothetical protein
MTWAGPGGVGLEAGVVTAGVVAWGVVGEVTAPDPERVAVGVVEDRVLELDELCVELKTPPT